MTDVINVNSFKLIFIDLGWDSTVSPSEFADWLTTSGISPITVYAYCEALKNNPNGLDDTTIQGIDPGVLPYIRDHLVSLGVLYR